MKTLIKSTIIASTFFAASVMAAPAYDSDIFSHPVQGIMSAAATDTSSFSEFANVLSSHPVEGYMTDSSPQTGMAATHCLNNDTFLALETHPVEGILDMTSQRC